MAPSGSTPRTALRIGVLGAARIAPQAIIKPARRVDDVEVVAVAARDRSRAEGFARKHGIPRVLDGYDALVADPDIDAIYNPLPNGLHGRWTIAALEAGKHVLCEKPFTANAEEAEEVAKVAAHVDLVCMEAFHYRYHPLAQRMVDVVRSGELGAVRHVETRMCIPLLPPNDIRWNLALAGGTMMDVGCYAIHLLRSLCGAEPEVTSASARTRVKDVDRSVEASMRLPNGATGKITVSMLSRKLLSLGARVVGDKGELRVTNPYAPQFFHRFVLRKGGSRERERFTRDPTYLFQLRAFAGAVLRGEPTLTGTDDAIANMRVIDAVYRAAGMQPRQPTPA
jgi:predicted dehydrogenase